MCVYVVLVLQWKPTCVLCCAAGGLYQTCISLLFFFFFCGKCPRDSQFSSVQSVHLSSACLQLGRVLRCSGQLLAAIVVVVVQPLSLSLCSFSLPTCGCHQIYNSTSEVRERERERERRGAEVIRLSHAADGGGSRSRPLDVVASGDVLHGGQTTAHKQLQQQKQQQKKRRPEHPKVR